MSAARIAVTALVAVAVVDVFHTVVALALYQHRIDVVTHDGSLVVEVLDVIAPLRDVSPVLAQLLLLTLVAAVAAVATWIVRIRDSGLPLPSMTRWRWSAIVAVPLNLIAAVQYLSATEQGAEHMRAVQTETALLLVAACLALVITAVLGVAVIRRTTADQHAVTTT